MDKIKNREREREREKEKGKEEILQRRMNWMCV